MSTNTDTGAIREQIREYYAKAARTVTDRTAGSCCSIDSCTADGGDFGASEYDEASRSVLPAGAVAASLGCGNPTTVAELNAEFLKGDIESLPLPAASVDVVISNCVVADGMHSAIIRATKPDSTARR